MNEWILAHDATKGDMAYALECTRCGTIQRVATPINITCWLAMAKAFGKMHSGCKSRGQQHPEVKP